MICMKTRGQIVKEWREARQWNTRELAKAIGTSRQNIENLEADAVDVPRYLPKLARLMGYESSDDLRELKAPPTSGDTVTVEEPHEKSDAEEDFVPTSEEEWRLFQAFKLLSPEMQKKHLAQVEQDAMVEMGRQLFEERLRSKGFALDERVATAYGTPSVGPAGPGWKQVASPTAAPTAPAKKKGTI